MRYTLFRRLFRKARNLPSELALRIINIGVIERSLRSGYERHRSCHEHALPVLSPADASIVETLRRDGVCVTSLAALGLDGAQDPIQSTQTIAADFAARKQAGTYAGWETVMAGADDITRHPAIFAWGLQQRLIDIVESYLGLPVAYDGLNLFYTIADGRQVGTRKWHRDREDRLMIKIAVYCNDVDDGGGPLQILRRGVIDPALEAGFDYPVLSQEKLEALLGRAPTDDEVITCTGLSGTVIFSDTASQYHRGKPALTSDRCAIFYNYFARIPRHPFFCDRSGLSRRQIAALVDAMPEKQRHAALWVEDLPWIARLVPKNRY